MPSVERSDNSMSVVICGRWGARPSRMSPDKAANRLYLVEAGGSCPVPPARARQNGEAHRPEPEDRVLSSGLRIRWAGRRRGAGAGWGLTHVQRRKSGSSTWSHRPSPSWQHSSARGLMGSPTARASTPSVSVGARAWLVLGCDMSQRGARPKPGGPKTVAGGNSGIPLRLESGGKSASFDQKIAVLPWGMDLHEHLSPYPALGTLPVPLTHPGSGSAQAGGPRGPSAGTPAGVP